MAKKETQATAKVFMTGPSQAVRLPQAFRFECDTVSIRREGASLVLTPLPRTWDDLLIAGGEAFSDEFIEAVLDDGDLLPIETQADIQ